MGSPADTAYLFPSLSQQHYSKVSHIIESPVLGADNTTQVVIHPLIEREIMAKVLRVHRPQFGKTTLSSFGGKDLFLLTSLYSPGLNFPPANFPDFQISERHKSPAAQIHSRRLERGHLLDSMQAFGGLAVWMRSNVK